MHAMKAYGGVEIWGSGNIAPLTLNLSASWRWVVSFAPPPLYPRRKSHRLPLKRIFGGPHSRSGSFGEEKNSFSPPEINHDCHSFRNLATIPNELSPLLGSKGAGNLFTSVVRIKFWKLLFRGSIYTLISELKTEAVCSSETYVSTYQTTRCHNAEEDHKMDVLHSLATFSNLKHAPYTELTSSIWQ